MTIDERLDYVRGALGFVNPPTVKSICESYSQIEGESARNAIERIQVAIPYIFDFDFPIADEEHRQELETKIIKNYYFRQICCVDVEEWKLRLSNKLMQIMPYYNELYKSQDYLKGNILDDVDYERKVEEGTNNSGLESTKSTQNSESSGHNTSKGIDSDTNTASKNSVGKFSDTPQGQLDSVLDGTYLTNATVGDETSNSQRSGMSNREGNTTASSDTTGTFDTVSANTGNRDMTEHVKGKMGMKSKASVVMEYRKAILNIDTEIVSRLSDLFMNVYNVWGE